MNAVEAHIEAQARIRAQVAARMAASWRSLPSYDESDVPAFVAEALRNVAAGQRASASITAAFLAFRLGEPVAPVDVAAVTGAAPRNGTPPEDVYRRPFVTVWTALQSGTAYDAAVAAGLSRATSAAAMDIQLTMRATLRDVGERTGRIVGYARVPDAGACAFCRLVAGQRYTTADLMPVHNHCGCGVDVITAANRPEFTGKPENDLDLGPDDVGVRVAVEEHGELGPLLVNAADRFTQL